MHPEPDNGVDLTEIIVSENDILELPEDPEDAEGAAPSQETRDDVQKLLEGTQSWPMDGSGNVWIGPEESSPYDSGGGNPMIGSAD